MRTRLAISIGDPNGIGPEVTLKALADEGVLERIDPVVVGAPAVLDHYARKYGLMETRARLAIEEVARGEEVVEEGLITSSGGAQAMAAVARACDLCLDGAVEGMVTAPIHKEAIHLAGHHFPGHTEYLAERSGANGFVMLMAADDLRVALVTTHIPLRDVAAAVTVTSVLDVLTRLADGLRRDFGIEQPRLAMLGMNPHAGDGGVIGTEDLDTVAPAIALARQRGIEVGGPFAADGFFGRGAQAGFDAVLATYHDQGLVPFKALTMGRGVNVTLGLPIVRTSPDHGTAFDIAGHGQADPASMIAALHMAADFATRRREQDAEPDRPLEPASGVPC